MEQIETIIQTIATNTKPTVLAMIVDIDGSAYRKEGAWMLFQEDTPPIGMISGGCLENDLLKRAQQLFNTGKTELISYDMSAEDDLGWGRGAGCNGTVHILLRAIDEKFRASLIKVNKILQNREPVLYIQSMTNFTQYIFSSEQEDPFDFWDKESDAEWIDRKSFQKIAGQRKFGSALYFIQLIWPKPNFTIIGAGIDARPLAHFASEVGFTVHVVDWREELCKPDYFPTVSTVRCQSNRNLLNSVNLSPLDAIVIMTHDFQTDLQLVDQLVNKNLLYFGLLGSEKRTERLVGGKIPKHIRTPAGLMIGADGPHEIAISILAELIAVVRGKKV